MKWKRAEEEQEQILRPEGDLADLSEGFQVFLHHVSWETGSHAADLTITQQIHQGCERAAVFEQPNCPQELFSHLDDPVLSHTHTHTHTLLLAAAACLDGRVTQRLRRWLSSPSACVLAGHIHLSWLMITHLHAGWEVKVEGGQWRREACVPQHLEHTRGPDVSWL